LIPLKENPVPAEDADFELIDTTTVYREIPYEEQQDYLLTAREEKKEDAKPSDGSDW
jgi:hypothetical protein